MRKTITYRRPEADPTGVHVVLWVETRPSGKGGRPGSPGVRPTRRTAWPVACLRDSVACNGRVDFETPDQLLDLLTCARDRRMPLTVWVPRGWESLCMTGLADLIDRGAVTYSRLTLDGERVILRGKVGKLPLTVTSLTAWTGGAWDEWRDKLDGVLGPEDATEADPGVMAEFASASPGERVALGTVVAILRSCVALGLGPPAASLGSMARRWWASWGGRSCRDNAPDTVKRPPRGRKRVRRIVYPVPRRPRVAGQAEAHVAHGLIREQYYRGRVGAGVHVVDLRQAYLLALALAPIPAVYERTEANLYPGSLAGWMRTGEACALCRLHGVTMPVTQWRDRRPRRVVGNFWAWLSGADLCYQLAGGTVAEVHTAHLWRAIRHTKLSRSCLLNVGPQLREQCGRWAIPFWRGLYSALPGSWAQSVYQWRDCRQEFRSGRWATFVMAGKAPGEVDHYRVVGGRVQRRQFKGEAPHALPLAYAAVTSCVRDQVDFMREALPSGSVLAVACDSLWVTDAGLEALRAGDQDGEPEGKNWAVKDSWDDAWLDGHGGAVVSRGGLLYPLTAGVPQSAPLGEDGRARWSRAEPWCAGTTPDPNARRARARSSWDGGKLVRANSGPLVRVDPWMHVDEFTLSESLLLPFDPLTTGATDADEAAL